MANLSFKKNSGSNLGLSSLLWAWNCKKKILFYRIYNVYEIYIKKFNLNGKYYNEEKL